MACSGRGSSPPGASSPLRAVHPVGTLLRNEVARVGDLAIEVDDPAEARRLLERQVERFGTDLVKVIYSSIPGDGPRLRRDVLEALVEEAHRLGRRVFAHVSTTDRMVHDADPAPYIDARRPDGLVGATVLRSARAWAATQASAPTPTGRCRRGNGPSS